MRLKPRGHFPTTRMEPEPAGKHPNHQDVGTSNHHDGAKEVGREVVGFVGSKRVSRDRGPRREVPEKK
uniref:Uncharacterized protein n=1 Tax=Ditylenchus dipsaci TaxID=166011 RepID=A0A915DN69_9BILA